MKKDQIDKNINKYLEGRIQKGMGCYTEIIRKVGREKWMSVWELSF